MGELLDIDHVHYGIDPETGKKRKNTHKKDLAPSPWEVREKLKDFIQSHEDKIEKEMEDPRYPIIVKGEIDPSLRSHKNRKKKRKLIEKEKEAVYLRNANEKLKDKSNSQNTLEKDVQKKMKKLYEETRNKYHRSVAPTRFHKS